MMDAVIALIPPICVGLLFAFVIRAMIGADRREREARTRELRDQDQTIRGSDGQGSPPPVG